jgi:hypothetical protein
VDEHKLKWDGAKQGIAKRDEPKWGQAKMGVKQIVNQSCSQL